MARFTLDDFNDVAASEGAGGNAGSRRFTLDDFNDLEPATQETSLNTVTPSRERVSARLPERDTVSEQPEAKQSSPFDRVPGSFFGGREMPGEGGIDFNRGESAAKGFVQGAGQTASGVVKRAATITAPPPEVFKNLDRIDETGNRGPAGFAVGVPGAMTVVDPYEDLYNRYQQADPSERTSIRNELVAEAKEATSHRAMQAGRDMDKWFAENFPTDPQYEGEFWTDVVPKAAGSGFTFLTAAALSRGAARPLGAGAQTVSSYATPSLLGSAMNSSQLFEEALDSGADIETALEASDIGSYIGLAEGVPIGGLLERMDKGSGGAIKRYLKRAMLQGTEEAIQETLTGIMNTAVAQDLYDPERGMWTMERAEEGGAGFVTGALMETVLTLVSPRRRGAMTDQPSTPPGQTPLDPPDGGPEDTQDAVTPDDATRFAQDRLQSLYQQPDLNDTERAERDFLAENATNPEAVATAYGVKLRSPGIRETARNETPPPSPGDIESPLDTDLVQEGRTILNDALGAQQANDALQQAEFPQVDTPVTYRDGQGNEFRGTVIDAYIDEDGQTGAVIELEDARTVAMPVVRLRSRVSVAGQPGPAQEAIQEPVEPQQPEGTVHTMPDGSVMAGPEHEGAVPGSTREAEGPIDPGRYGEGQQFQTGGAGVQEVPLGQLSLSEDIPQFKGGANERGVVEPLGGQFDRRGVGPIQVWERSDGRLEVISGRHRLDLAQRSGEETIPAQIYRESEGFDLTQAASLDAELNIRDGQGRVADYVQYFQGSEITEGEAESRGLLARATGKRAFTLATQGSEDLVAAHRAGEITDEGAVAVAQAAPNDARLQAVGLKALQDGKTIGVASNLVHAVRSMAGSGPDSLDMFGFDDSAMRQAEDMAKAAAARQRSLSQRISAVSGAARNPDLARREGVNVNDPEAVNARVKELRQERERWNTWSTDPELVAELRAEVGMPEAPTQPEQEPEPEPEPTTQEGLGLFDAPATPPAGELVDDTSLAEETRANVAGESPERASLIVLRDMLEAGTDSMNDEGQVPSEIRGEAIRLRDRLDSALSGDGDLAAIQREAYDTLNSWLTESDLGEADAEFRAIRERVGSQAGLDAPTAQQPATLATPATGTGGVLTLEDFTDKSVIVRGETKENIERIKAAGKSIGVRALWNKRAQGWVFPKKREDAVREQLADLLQGLPETATSLRGEPINDEWTAFNPDMTLGVPRDQMPQVKAEHRGALANFLIARGIRGDEQTVPASSLMPTQREFSEDKVDTAKAFTGGDRAILVSNDNRILDGHHQWMAAVDRGEEIRVIRLDAPIADLLEQIPEFPSAEVSEGGFTLDQETEAQRAEREAREQKARDDAASEAREAEQRAQADADVGGFTLTGSSRPADANPDQVDLTAEAEQERRDREQREIYSRRIEDMSATELREYATQLRTALMTDERTGLGSNRAWINRTPKRFVASVDLDSLKWVNDNMGHDAGDRMIAAVGDAMRESGMAEDAFHVSGDEFYAQADTEAGLREALEAARSALAGMTITGEGFQYTGPGFSYGIAESLDAAERLLHEDKSNRETNGARPQRGERPAGVAETRETAEQEATTGDGTQAATTGQGQGTERPQPPVARKRRQRKPKKPSLLDRLENYFRPGRIVEGYAGQDRVVSFNRDGNDWSVTVHRVDQNGERTENDRTHRTSPSSRDLAAWERDNPVSTEAPAPAQGSLADQLANTSDDDLSSMLDEIANETGAVETDKPADSRAGRSKTAAGRTKLRPKATPAERTDVTDDEAVRAQADRTAGQIAGSLGVNLSSGGKEALTGLTKLFGGPGKLNSGLSFDEKTYQEAKPHFQKMLTDFTAAGRDLRDLLRALVESFGTGIKPYVLRFAQDLRTENANVERDAVGTAEDSGDRQDAAPESAPDIQDGGRGRGGRGVTGTSQAPGAGQQPGDAVGDDGTTAAGERGDQSFYDEKSRLEDGAARDTDNPGSRPDSTGGLFADRETGPAADNVAEKAPAVAPAPPSAPASIRLADRAQIASQMPFLSEGQIDDVVFAERRLSKPDGFGVLFTNGTGTGKTFTGLGVVRRLVDSGKGRILIAVPKQPIGNAWIKAARDYFGLEINALESTRDVGSGIVVTTYANIGDNHALAAENWDAFVVDEAHYLASNQQGDETKALRMLNALGRKTDSAGDLATFRNPGLTERRAELQRRAESLRRMDNNNTRGEEAEIAEEMKDLDAQWNAALEQAQEDVTGTRNEDKPRAVFLSATPFAYEKNVRWAQEWLFDVNPPGSNEANEFRGYNSGGNFERFMMTHFGYRMRYNKLTEPDSKVDRGAMQRAFNTWLKKEGALSARALDSDYDYDRRFVMAESAIGKRVDDALEWLRDQGSIAYQADESTEALEWGNLLKKINDSFDYQSRMYFLEAIKAKEAIPHIRDHLDMGRKVMVVHDFKKGGTSNPFVIGNIDNEEQGSLYQRFLSQFNDLIRAFDALPSPIVQLTKEFPDALVYNGDVTAKNRLQLQNQFNSDDAGSPKLMIAQSDAIREGVSIHDTTGVHQRVEINLGMPAKPTAAIQLEGRIYRTGQASDAMFRYFTIGTNWERYAFASKIAGRTSAAENLAMGEEARGLKEAFINAYEEADTWQPGYEGEGTGGKESDKAFTSALTPWDMAKSFYFGTKKQGSGRKARGREGKDYFATPEPLGMKMVQWADLRGGESALEPSAGHGAIARWFPENTTNRAIEFENELASKVALHFDGQVQTGDFMQHNVVNKYDAIVMNPPFGQGGAEARDHVAKAIKHLRDGGRVVALVPTGPAADKKFEALLESDDAKDVYTAAIIQLPAVTFERAGTKVMTRVLVLEKQTNKDLAAQIQQQNRDYSNAEDIEELFDRLEDSEIRPRLAPEPQETPEATATAPDAAPSSESTGGMETWMAEHSQTGETLYMAKAKNRIERDEYKALAAIARRNNGYWSRFGKAGFLFKTEADRAAFLSEAGSEGGQFALRDGAFNPETPVLREYRNAIYSASDSLVDESGLLIGEISQYEDSAMDAGAAEDIFDRKMNGSWIESVAIPLSEADAASVIGRVNSSTWYHGSPISDIGRVSRGDAGGLFLAPSREGAQAYGGSVYEVRPSVSRPLFVETGDTTADMESSGEIQNAIDAGYDSIVPLDGGEIVVISDAAIAPRQRITYALRSDQTSTPEFRRWFGDSKVVDDNGDPLVVYHGTHDDFDGFDTSGDLARHPSATMGAYFTTDVNVTDGFVHQWKGRYFDGANVVPAYLAIKNPMQVTWGEFRRRFAPDWSAGVEPGDSQWETLSDRVLAFREELEAQGYDGVQVRRSKTSRDPEAKADNWIAFRPEQIKSATGNRGTFDPSDPRITYALRDEFTSDAEAITADLTERLQQLGISDRVAVRLRERIEAVANGTASEADGRYLNRLIEVSMTAGDQARTLNHEVIHALRDLGAIRAAEWRQLERAARADTDAFNRIKRRYEALGLSEEAVVEEAVAEMYADWAGERTQAGGFLRRGFERIRDFIQALGNALRGRGFTSTGQVFRDIESGTVGRRRGEARQPGAAGSQFALKPGDFNPNRANAFRFNGGTAETVPLPPAFSDGFANVDETMIDLVRQKLQDKYIDLRRLQEAAGDTLPDDLDAYMAEELYHGKADAAIQDARESTMKPLIDAIREAGLTVEQAGEYLYARHAAERNARIQEINPEFDEGGSGMTDEEAAAILTKYTGPKIQRIGELVDSITQRHRNLLVSSGLEKPSAVEAWEAMYEHYVPLKGRPGEDDARVSPAPGRGFDVRGRTKSATGRRSLANNVVSNLLAQYETDLIRAQKAEVGRALLRFVEANPDPAIWEVDKIEYAGKINPNTGLVEYRPDSRYQLADNVLVVKIDGVDHHITFHGNRGKRIAAAMKNLGAANAGVFVRSFASVNRFLSAVNTSFNPEFVISNLARDLQTAGINLAGTEADALKGKILRDVPAAWRGIRREQKGKDGEWAQYFDEFRRAGGKTGWVDAHSDVTRLHKQLEKEIRAHQRSKGDPRNMMKAIGDFVEAENIAVENAVRLSSFVHARKAGMSEARAASLAKNLTVNFNRKGEYGVVMNSFYLFYNASIQGNIRMLQALRSPKVRKLAAGIVVFATMLDMINRMLGGEDDDDIPLYDKIPPWEKDRNMIFMNPLSEKGYFKIPLPWGYNVFHVLGQEIGAAASSAMGFKPDYRPLDSTGRIIDAVLSAFNPLGSDSSLGQFLSPTLTDPIISLEANRDWAGRPIRPGENPFARAPEPDSQKFWSSTGEGPRWVTEQLNELTGGSEVRPGVIDVSPTTLEYLYEFATGGAGRFLYNMVDAPLKQMVEGEVETYRIPFLRKVYGEVGARSTQDAFYSNLEQVYYAEQERSMADESGDVATKRQVEREHSAYLRARVPAKAAESALRDLRERRNIIRSKPNIPESRRRKDLQEVEDRMEQEMMRFNKRVRQLQGRD